MTPAEKMAEQLEADSYALPARDYTNKAEPINSCTEAAEMIRRLAAALLFANDQLNQNGQAMLKYHHADALRDVKEMS